MSNSEEYIKYILDLPKESIQYLPYSEILNFISSLSKEIEVNNCKIDYYNSIRLINHMHISQAYKLIIPGCFRGRINKNGEIFHNLKNDLLCPPKNRVTLGRMNKVNDPKLYLSSSIKTVIKELDADNGDYLTVIEFKNQNQIELMCLCPGMLTVEYKNKFSTGIVNINFINEYNKFKNKLSEDKFNLKIFVDNFLEKIVTKRNINCDALYMATSELAELYFSMPHVDCIIYPSVANELNSLNICTNEVTVNNILSPVKITFLEVTNKVQATYKPLAVSNNIDLKTGDIKYIKI